jgi:excisionase family DNA binding protein
MPSPQDPPLLQPLVNHHAEKRGAAASNPPHQPPTDDQPEGPHSLVSPATRRAGPPATAASLTPARELLRVEEAAERLAIGRTSMFALLKERTVESVKVGRLRRVPLDSLTAYINSLVADQRSTAA